MKLEEEERSEQKLNEVRAESGRSGRTEECADGLGRMPTAPSSVSEERRAPGAQILKRTGFRGDWRN